LTIAGKSRCVAAIKRTSTLCVRLLPSLSNSCSCKTRSSFAWSSKGISPTSSRKSRSEEHTSELQSRFDLVCRLLLEKKKPKKNGKFERNQQTLKREWALGQRYRSSTHRAQALPHWLNHYNDRRRHSAIGNQPPTSPV